MTKQNWGFNTRQIHAGYRPDKEAGSPVPPLYQTNGYVFKDAKQGANRFALKEPGPIYTRLNNPTNEVFEQRVNSLEGGVGALSTSSGASAIALTILTIAQAGDNIVASPSLYGGTLAFLANNLPRYGITTTFVTDPTDGAQWEAATNERTIAFFAETIPNPKNDFLDIEGVAEVAKRVGVPFIVDNTVATPYLTRPLEWGADIVVHSASKYLCGHGNSIQGVIVDGGSFDWGADPERFPQFNQPDPSYHGLVYKDLGEAAFITKARVQGLRDFGFAVSPFNSFLVNIGIETLSLRVQRHVENAQKVAEFLEAHPQVASVSYSGLASSPTHGLQQKYAPGGAGAVLAFDLKGNRADGEAFVDALQLLTNVANLGDLRSQVIHPASTTHSQANEQELAAAGISQSTIRVSVGLEDVADIIIDLEAGFAAIKK